MPIALVRRPGPRLMDGLVTQQRRVPVDVARAARQWSEYVDRLREHGWAIREVAPADEHPDAVFVEDALVVFGDLAVITRPGAMERQGETAGAESAARELGLEVVTIEPPAQLDGGDVLKIGSDVYVGVGGRTDSGAVAQLGELLAQRGWRVHAVPVRSVLHLKSAVTALPDGTVIGFPDLVDDMAAFERFEPVPEPEGAHVVLLDDHRLLMSSAAPRTADLLRDRGYEPVPVDISEFEKLEGCVTCLSVRIRSLSADGVAGAR